LLFVRLPFKNSSADKPLFWLLLSLLVWAPIPLGSNRPWAWTLLEIGIYALLVAWLILFAAGKANVSDSASAAWLPLAVLAIWLALQLLHILPLAESLVEWLSPEAARIHSSTTAIGVPSTPFTLSVDPYTSGTSFLKSLAYCGTFLLLLLLVNSRSRVQTFARCLVYSAVIHSIYAVLMHLAKIDDEHFGTLINHGESASGTYANRNHFAGYLEMMLSLGIGLLIAGLSDRRADSWKRFVKHLIEWILSPKMLLRLALCILVIALTTTHSRMGNTGFFSSLLIAGVIGIALSRRATRNTVILLASLVLIDLMIVGSWFGVEKLAQRLEQTTGEDIRIREEPAGYTRALIGDYPLVGTGPGTFYIAFPKYRPESILGFFDYAHNDYAQFAAESGLIGLALLGAFVAFTLLAALKAQALRRDPLMRGISFACIMGITAMLIHAWVEFNFQIPANAMYFMALAALGWISLNLDRHGVPGVANVGAAQ
jgi:putative inorganic carbon (HCO3(-)) transporter